jgi:hypothetical protein
MLVEEHDDKILHMLVDVGVRVTREEREFVDHKHTLVRDVWDRHEIVLRAAGYKNEVQFKMCVDPERYDPERWKC